MIISHEILLEGVHSQCLELLENIHLSLFVGSVLDAFCHFVLY